MRRREIFRRFAHLRHIDHVYRLAPELVEYIRENTVPWTGEDARALGLHLHPGRRPTPPPITNGLEGRLKRRRG